MVLLFRSTLVTGTNADRLEGIGAVGRALAIHMRLLGSNCLL
jgi:hypothetical protein